MRVYTEHGGPLIHQPLDEVADNGVAYRQVRRVRGRFLVRGQVQGNRSPVGIALPHDCVVAPELVGVFGAIDLVLDDNGEAVRLVNEENVDVTPLAEYQQSVQGPPVEVTGGIGPQQVGRL